MKRLLLGVFTAVLVLVCWFSPVSAAWADHFPGPVITAPGVDKAPGPVLGTLTPELKYQGVGAVTYIYIYDAQYSRLTLEDEIRNAPRPVLMAQADITSFKVPAGVLLPGHSYYWYVESIHAPGSKSEAIKNSPTLYFSIAPDAK